MPETGSDPSLSPTDILCLNKCGAGCEYKGCIGMYSGSERCHLASFMLEQHIMQLQQEIFESMCCCKNVCSPIVNDVQKWVTLAKCYGKEQHRKGLF